MIILAVYNIKGGVGKTAGAVNLSYQAAGEGSKTLVCDLDPQSAATFYFRVVPKVKKGRSAFLENPKAMIDSVKETDYENLDLLPADFSFRKLDLALHRRKHPRELLAQTLRAVGDDYDWVFLDCPPNLTLLAEHVFSCADYILHPTIPTVLSLRTYKTLRTFFKRKGLSRDKLLPFFSMYEKRKKMHRELMAFMLQNYQRMLTTAIPYASEIERMGIRREPVGKTFPGGIAARAYETLWREIKGRIERGGVPEPRSGL